ncbi:NAD+ synthase [Candidatus Woesearchaeota archaeon]|nr:NAD+ synthase [Candidatus Woesearchaeota archaeon]
MPNEDMGKTYRSLIGGIKDYFKKNNFKKAVIGLSGGIDSALSAKLAADAIGKENIKALIMPVRGLSSEESIQDAVEFCTITGIGYQLIFINDFIGKFEKVGWAQNDTAKMNTASRIRAVILYNYANSNNALVIGTSNKTEILMGYFTKYGDGAADAEVIGDLYKTEVKKLSEFLGLPKKIICKTPTAELYPGQTDEKELGISYDELDKILKLYFEEKNSVEGITKKGFERKAVEGVIKRIKLNEHKRRMPLILKAKG